jgi:hypothetical protein
VCRRGKEDQKLLGDINFLEIRERTGLSRADPPVGLGGKFRYQCKLCVLGLGAHKNCHIKILSLYALDEKNGRDRLFQMGSAVV